MNPEELDLPSDSELRELLMNKMKARAPKLSDEFNEEVRGHVGTLRERIQNLLGRRKPISAEEAIKRASDGIVDRWTKEKLQKFAYPRYVELMNELGQEPLDFTEFTNPFSNNARRGKQDRSGGSPCDRFIALEEKKIGIGTQVVRSSGGEAPFIITSISPHVICSGEDNTRRQRAIYKAQLFTVLDPNTAEPDQHPPESQ